MSKTLAQLRQATAQLMNMGEIAMVMGTPAVTFSTTGFTCGDLALDETDFYKDWYLRFYSGTHKDITRRVTSSIITTGAIVFSPALTGAVDVTDLFELHRDFLPEEYNNAINMAIAMIQDEVLEDKLDETLTIVADTYEYAVPAGFYAIDGIIQGDSSNKYFQSAAIGLKAWKIINAAGTKKIWFDKELVSLTAGYKLRLTGQSLASQLSLDASTTDINSAYIVQQAKALLHQSRITGSGVVSEMHDRQMAVAQSLAQQNRPTQVSVRGWRV
jgi:hypothetical protein